MNAKRTHILGLAIALTATLGFSGCASTSNKPAFSSGNVAYGDTAVQENLTNEISSNDFTKLSKSMTDSLLTSALIRNSNERKKPTVTISQVKNKTSEHIDTRTITNSIENQLMASEAVEFVSDRSEDELVQLELQRQTQSGEYKASKSAKSGQAEGAKYMLMGEISSIVKNAGDIKNIDYILQLKLIEVETRKKVWAAEDKIRKTSERPTF